MIGQKERIENESKERIIRRGGVKQRMVSRKKGEIARAETKSEKREKSEGDRYSALIAEKVVVHE